MGMRFWIKHGRIRQFAMVWLLALGIIVIGQLLQARGLEHALLQGVIWAPISAAVYIAVALYKSRKCRIAKLSPVHGRKNGPDPRAPKLDDPDFIDAGANNSAADARTRP